MLDICTTFVPYEIFKLCSNPDLQASKLKHWYFKQFAKNCIDILVPDLSITLLWEQDTDFGLVCASEIVLYIWYFVHTF